MKKIILSTIIIFGFGIVNSQELISVFQDGKNISLTLKTSSGELVERGLISSSSHDLCGFIIDNKEKRVAIAIRNSSYWRDAMNNKDVVITHHYTYDETTKNIGYVGASRSEVALSPKEKMEVNFLDFERVAIQTDISNSNKIVPVAIKSSPEYYLNPSNNVQYDNSIMDKK